MAKKARGEAPEPTGSTVVPSRDVLQRLSYLYQASAVLSNVLGRADSRERAMDGRQNGDKEGARDIERLDEEGIRGRLLSTRGDQRRQGATRTSAPSYCSSRGGKKRRRLQVTLEDSAQGGAEQPASRVLARMMGEVAQKATVRMDPSVKRTLCKGCNTVLVPGLTCSVRVKPSGPHAHLIINTCTTCRTTRRLPAPPHAPDPPLLPPGNEGLTAEVAQNHGPDSAPAAAATSKRTKRESKEARQARQPVFFERKGHLAFAGDKLVSRDDQ